MRRPALTLLFLATAGGLSLAAPPAPVPIHQRMALLIGVDRYQDPSITRDLHGCRNDVSEMAEVLRTKYRFAQRTLVDHEATRQAVKAALADAVEKAEPSDQVVLFFSGYGSVDGNGKPTLCTYDALAASAKQDLWAGDLWSWVNGIGRKGAHPVVILDCAFVDPAAIAMGPRIRPKCLVRTPAPGPEAGGGLEVALQNIAEAAPGGVVLTACRPGELAREMDRGNDNWIGVFSYCGIRQLQAGAEGEPLTFQGLRDGLASKVGALIYDVFYGDSYVQTPALYGQTEYLAQAALFSSGPAVAPAPPSNELRLRVADYGGGEAERQALRQQFARLPHVKLVDQDGDADESLYVFRSAKEVKAYLVDYAGKAVQSNFTTSPADQEAFIREVNARLSGLVAYRWLASLPPGDPSFGLKLWLNNDRGEVASQLAAGEWLTVNLEATRDCFATVYSVTPAFDCERVLPAPGTPEDSYRLTAGERWTKRVSPSQPDRYRLVAVAKARPDQPSSDILLSFWTPAMREYMRASETISLGEGGAAPAPAAPAGAVILPARPSFSGAERMGDASAAGGYATRVTELTVTEPRR